MLPFALKAVWFVLCLTGPRSFTFLEKELTDNCRYDELLGRTPSTGSYNQHFVAATALLHSNHGARRDILPW